MSEWSEQAIRILEERYLHDGETPDDMLRRVANEIASGDKEYGVSDGHILETAQRFYDVMSRFLFVPNSPTLMNGGLDNGLQYSACYVLPVPDSIEGIMQAVMYAAIIHQSGGGTGMSFTRLRPHNSMVKTSGGVASGPVSFMKIFDTATGEIKQGGRRRGANMGVLRVDHPDIEMFIECKLNGGITNFNISVGITQAFMEALADDDDYDLIAEPDWPGPDGIRYKGGEVIGQKNARTVFGKITSAAWKTGDPGLIFLDRINEGPQNPVPDLGLIESTNPCGETPLLPNEACNLGSINLARHITVEDGRPIVDWALFRETVETAVHFLDNVITVNPYPLKEIDEVVKANRRIGIGVMGWSDVLFTLGIPYDSTKALRLADEVMGFIKRVGHDASAALAEQRGPFPNWERSIYRKTRKLRNSTITTIAPTGSISIIAGPIGSGIEPAFGIVYQHTVPTPDGTKRILTFVNPVFEKTARDGGWWDEALKAKILETGSLHGLDEVPEDIRKVFVTAHEIEPYWHVKMQAAFQAHTDNGVSKTINLPNTASVKDIEDAYLLAYDEGCIGITAFRDGCKDFQVLTVGTGSKDAVDTPKVRDNALKGVTYKKETPVGKAYVTINSNGNEEPFEIFINVSKTGSEAAAMAEGLGRLISLILRLPGPLSAHERAEAVVGQLLGIGSGRPLGFGPERVESLPDGVAQVIAEHTGLLTETLPGLPDVGQAVRIGDLCPACGAASLVREEGCQKCYSCGNSAC